MKPGKQLSHGFLASESLLLRVSGFPAQTLISVVELSAFKAASFMTFATFQRAALRRSDAVGR
jgi:hypothetical protein